MLEPIEFRSPIAKIKFSNGRELPVLFDPVWQRRFKALWDLLDGLVDESESSASDGATTNNSGAQIQSLISLIQPSRRPDNGARAQEAKDAVAIADRPKSDARVQDAASIGLSAPLSPPRPPCDVKEAILAAGPSRRDFSTFKFIADSAANQANYPAAAYPNALYLATDTYDWYHPNDGAGWTQIIYPTILYLVSAAATHGALARSGAGIESRLGDNSTASFMKVLDEVYGAGWDGSTEVPTKNAVYDKIEAVIAAAVALVSDAAYGAGWNGVTTIAPSKNVVYDEMITKLTANGVNFGPAAVASITVVDGQVTAVS